MTQTATSPGSVPPLTFTVTANFTADPIREPLAFWAARLGFTTPAFTFSSYNQLHQALMDPASALGSRTPGANFLLVRTEEWARNLEGDAAITRGLTDAVAAFIDALEGFAPRAARPTFVALLPPTPETREHPLRAALVAELDASIVRAAGRLRAVTVVTTEEIERLYPVTSVDDPDARRHGHVPFTAEYWTALATILMRRARVLLQAPTKLALVDADHTLWGGVVGEAGPAQVEVSGPWRALQELLVARKQQGLLVAIVSKNRPDDVAAVLARPDMALRPEHLVAIKASWEPKSTQIRALAAELGLGLASCVFLDDNPAECAEVAANCPEVTVLPLPADPAELPAFAAHLWPLDLPPATAADAGRTEQYRQQAERRHFRGAASSFRDFIERLELEVAIAPVEAAQIDRAAQLTQRTNQFNASGIRRTAAELGALLAAGTHTAYMVRVRDRFGDYGDVGLCITERRGADLVLETFLLSCRVLGKGVEHRLLAAIGEQAAAQGATQIVIPFRKTSRNEPAERFLRSIEGAGAHDALTEDAHVDRKQAAVAARGTNGPNGGNGVHGAPGASGLSDGAYRFSTTVACGVVFHPPEAADGESEAETDAPPARDARAETSVAQQGIARDGALARGVAGDQHAAAAEVPEAAPDFAAIASELRTVRAIADRIAQAAAAARPTLDTRFVAPRTPVEAALADIWARVLRLDRVGVEDRFFDLGGDSILGIQIIAQAARQGLRFTLRDQFERPTIAALAEVIERAAPHDDAVRDEAPRMSESAGIASGATGARAQSIYPLTPLQHGMLLQSLQLAGSGVAFEQDVYELRGPLDRDRFAAAWRHAVQRHDVLRTTFRWEGLDEPQQVVHAEAPLEITFDDWRTLAPEAQQARLDAARRAERARGFQLTALPLMRLALYRLADERHVFVWSFHHAILDGWSLPIVLRHVLRAYAGDLRDSAHAGGRGDVGDPRQGADSREAAVSLGAGAPGETGGWRNPQLLGSLSPERERENGWVGGNTRPYRDYVAWLRAQDAAATERFWRRTLAGVTSATPLTIDRRPSTASAANGAPDAAAAAAIADSLSDETWRCEAQALDPALSASAQAFARAHGLTLGTLLNGAWALLLARYAGVDDVTFGCTVSGRPAGMAGVESMVGLFINSLPLRVPVPADQPVLPWLRDLQRRVLDLTEQQHSPLVDVQRWSGVPAGQPLVESLVVIENFPDLAIDPRDAGGLEAIGDPWRRHTKTGFPLTLLVTPPTATATSATTATAMPAAIGLQIWYDTRRFEAPRIQALLGHLRTLLGAIVEDPTRATGDLPLLTAPERQQILVDWNATRRDYPRDACLHELIAAQVARTPEAPAVQFGTRQLSYRELDARAESLARWLRARGVGAGTRVALALERSIEMVVGLLGVLKAGGAYVPIDPGYPRERLAFMLEDCAAPVLLTQAHLLTHLPSTAGIVVQLDADWPAIERESSSATASPAAASQPARATDPAYMIYTSGSTGRPKGALNSHRGIVNRLLWMQEQYQLTADDAVLQKTPFSFDVSVWEFFWPLLAGARLVVAEPGGHQNPDYLARTIVSQRVTVLHFVPSMLRVFLEAPGAGSCRTLRDVICSGEALPADLARTFHATLPARLHNLYGPTEAAIDVTHWTCPRDPALALVPIGRPVANTQCYILDRRLQPVPVGVPGELHLGGVQVGMGYHGRPELTAEKFIPDPFSHDPFAPAPSHGEPRARLYKTGDLCRYLPDGSIEYLGRLDFQVKIRGFRIELGDIEAALASHPALRDVIVIARDEAPDDRQLVAYIVTTGEVAIEALRAHLAPRLPDYMIPAHFVTLDRLPLSPNGKVDRKALPKPATVRQTQAAFVPPATDLERQIAAIWCEVLGLPQVGTRDNFFEAGGQSLKLMRVHYRLRERLGRDLPIVALFQHPTIASLAEFLSVDHGADGHAQAPAGVGASYRTLADAHQDRAAQQREAARRMQLANQARRRS